MKRCFRYILLPFLLLVGIAVVGQGAESVAARTWTSSSGQKVKAEFIKMQYGMVHLKQADGKVIKIPKARLSAADQKVVDAFAPPPRKAPKAIQDLFGPKLTNVRKLDVPVHALGGKTIGVYFSAHWCPPCRAFTPKLVEFYNGLKKSGKPFEIVFVSSDRDKASMYGYMKEMKMPWLALPYGAEQKKTLATKYGVRGIPMLVILTPEGEVVTTNGRGEVQMGDAKVFDQWQAGKKP